VRSYAADQMRIVQSGSERKAYSPREHGPVAQLDRASDFGSEGCGFKSCRDRASTKGVRAPRFCPGVVGVIGRRGAQASNGKGGSTNRGLATIVSRDEHRLYDP
jgi:hypothetical protein